MSLVSTEAIVLKSIDFGEGHKIVIFFTQDFGKVKIVVKGAHSFKNKFGASLEPMSLSHIVFYNRPERDLQMMSQADLVESFLAIQRDFQLLTWSLYLLELVDEFTEERDKNKFLFILIKKTFELLKAEKSSDAKPPKDSVPGWKLLIKYFEIKLFQISGYGIQLKNCVNCSNIFVPNKDAYSLDIYRGGIVCEKCKKLNEFNLYIRGETLKILELFTMNGIDKIQRLRVSQKTFNELEKIVELYRKKYISKELKSLQFIKETNSIYS